MKKPERSWALIKSAVRDYLHHWPLYVKIMAIVVIPFNLLGVLSFAGADIATLSVYGSFASIIMNVALIWAIIERQKGGEPNVPRAYYTGVGQIVSYIITSAILVAMLIPFAIGFTLYSAAATPDIGTTPVELALIGGLALLVASPSFYLMVRYGLGLLLIMTDGLRPIAALRLSRALTLRRFWPVLGRLIPLVLFIFVLLIPIALITAGLSLLRAGTWAGVFFQIVSTLTILPIAYLYLLGLISSLKSPQK